jgi:hypothetical protein
MRERRVELAAIAVYKPPLKFNEYSVGASKRVHLQGRTRFTIVTGPTMLTRR